MISIIIPARKKEEQLHRVIDSIPQGYQIIVVGIKPMKLPKRAFEFVASKKKWRSELMNSGAKKAKHSILFFQHPDTFVDESVYEQVVKLSPQYIGGGVAMTFYPENFLLRCIRKCANMRMKLLPGGIYGDQCQFVRKPVFEKIGGFKELVLCEDVWFSSQLKKSGKVVFFKWCQTSSRRFIKKGILRQIFTNSLILLLYYLGVSDKKLRDLYGK